MNEELRGDPYERMLVDALREQLNAAADELPTQDELRASGEPVHSFSPAFERRMNALCAARRRQAWRKAHRKALRCLATTAALFVLVSAVTLARVDASRLPFVNFFLKDKGEYTEIRIERPTEPAPAQLTADLERYLPTYVPAGFMMTEVQEYEYNFYVQYTNSLDADQSYSVSFHSRAPDGLFDTEDSIVTREMIRGSEAIIAIKNERIIVIWMPNGHEYTIIGNIPKDEAIRILESTKNVI